MFSIVKLSNSFIPPMRTLKTGEQPERGRGPDLWPFSSVPPALPQDLLIRGHVPVAQSYLKPTPHLHETSLFSISLILPASSKEFVNRIFFVSQILFPVCCKRCV